MNNNVLRGVAKSGTFAFGSLLLTSLLVSTLLYFEVIGVRFADQLSYGLYAAILLITSFSAARIIGKRGLFVGLLIGLIVVGLGAMYRTVGAETGLGLGFAMRSAITLFVTCCGAVVGVNTKK